MNIIPGKLIEQRTMTVFSYFISSH